MTEPAMPTGPDSRDTAPQPPGGDTDLERDSGSTASTPRWVKVSGIIASVVVLLFVILHLAGGGFRHHAPGGDTPGGHKPLSSATEHVGQQP